jgi:uncharacterized membrane protein
MTKTEVLAVALVFGGDGWRHAWGTGGGWGWLWAPIVLLLWVGLIATVVWFVARTARPRERSGAE